MLLYFWCVTNTNACRFSLITVFSDEGLLLAERQARPSKDFVLVAVSTRGVYPMPLVWFSEHGRYEALRQDGFLLCVSYGVYARALDELQSELLKQRGVFSGNEAWLDACAATHQEAMGQLQEESYWGNFMGATLEVPEWPGPSDLKGLSVLNATPHELSFYFPGNDMCYTVPKSRLIVDPSGKTRTSRCINGAAIVRTEFLADAMIRDALQRWLELPENDGVLIVGSLIAAQAYPGLVHTMVALPGYERRPPAEKRMDARTFLTF